MNRIILLSIGFLCLLLGLIIYQEYRFHDGKLHIIFCDIGQGDAIIIKTPDEKVLLVDGGPDTSVVGCLSRHLPFWQREIDLILLTHPHADHFFGMFAVLERFKVKSFVSIDLLNASQTHKELLALLHAKQVPIRTVWEGDLWKIKALHIQVVGPDESYLKSLSPNGTVNECDACASLAMHVSYGNFDTLLVGDSEDAQMREMTPLLSSEIEVLQIPHHGSATGIDKGVLEILRPRLAVISVGTENRYNHPHPSILELLSSLQIPVRRTDLAGDIEVISDGKKWWLVE